jgi:predicted RNase H-like nuclease (RuvC/YqgF family)
MFEFISKKISNIKILHEGYTADNSTRILSTNQIYEIDQYRPITFVLKKLPRKFSLVKINTKNFQQNVSTRIFYFLFY